MDLISFLHASCPQVPIKMMQQLSTCSSPQSTAAPTNDIQVIAESGCCLMHAGAPHENDAAVVPILISPRPTAELANDFQVIAEIDACLMHAGVISAKMTQQLCPWSSAPHPLQH